MGVDPTPAPLGDVSIGASIETYSGSRFGSSGTMTAALIITTAVKAIPVTQIGYSGLMVPVMEDKLLARRWAQGAFNTDSVLAYSAVCGTGLDTISFTPGNTSGQVIARIVAGIDTTVGTFTPTGSSAQFTVTFNGAAVQSLTVPAPASLARVIAYGQAGDDNVSVTRNGSTPFTDSGNLTAGPDGCKTSEVPTGP